MHTESGTFFSEGNYQPDKFAPSFSEIPGTQAPIIRTLYLLGTQIQSCFVCPADSIFRKKKKYSCRLSSKLLFPPPPSQLCLGWSTRTVPAAMNQRGTHQRHVIDHEFGGSLTGHYCNIASFLGSTTSWAGSGQRRRLRWPRPLQNLRMPDKFVALTSLWWITTGHHSVLQLYCNTDYKVAMFKFKLKCASPAWGRQANILGAL